MNLRRDQSGQAVVFVLVFLGVILLSMAFLFKSGQLTTEKMQLQNGADSAAYTASTLEARAMNFTAYTNRAMVANEVAIGQMVGLLSWADELVAIGEAFELLGGLLDSTIVLAEAGAALNAVGAGFLTAGKTMTAGLLAVAPLATRGISMVNTVYSLSQEIYHLTTILLFTNAIFKSLEDNVPGTPGDYFIKRLRPSKEGAQLSPIGLVALAGHIASYVDGFSSRYALKSAGSSEQNRNGMGRLAATIREGRDAFSSGDTTPNSKGISQDRGWALKGKATASMGIDIKLVRAKITGTFTYGIESVGGSEIRYKKGKNTFIWSGVDTASWEDAIDVIIKPPLVKSYKQHFKLPSLPLAGGAYQANGVEQSLNLDDMPRTLRQYGSPPAYGGAAANKYWGGWSEAGLKIAGKKIQSYPNLQGYRDVDPGKKEGGNILPFTAPFFLIGVIRPMKDIEGQGPQFAAPLDLPYAGEVDGSLGAFAKAEVYHCRPDDISYFRRNDGKTEKDNLFSPFWQARLVKTKNLDRLLGLALQQNVIWLSNEDAKNVPGMKNLKDKLQLWIGKLTALMGVLL
ncbi:MAG: hypothetical protein VR65_14605 [Desulfobulbaceae bacterium BRH_c16a]|nr:MAG: hypothetical protein VR65_14605 [Desulfobulbaceae bacterium BRH_c16a]